MSCPHCGWSNTQMPTKMNLVGWPEGMPPPPKLPAYEWHPANSCPSRFKIGDEVFWGGGEGGADLPPVLGTFVKLVRFDGPSFNLTPEGTWQEVSKAVPSGAVIETADGKLLVSYKDIELLSHWPVLVLD